MKITRKMSTFFKTIDKAYNDYCQRVGSVVSPF